MDKTLAQPPLSSRNEDHERADLVALVERARTPSEWLGKPCCEKHPA